MPNLTVNHAFRKHSADIHALFSGYLTVFRMHNYSTPAPYQCRCCGHSFEKIPREFAEVGSKRIVNLLEIAKTGSVGALNRLCVELDIHCPECETLPGSIISYFKYIRALNRDGLSTYLSVGGNGPKSFSFSRKRIHTCLLCNSFIEISPNEVLKSVETKILPCPCCAKGNFITKDSTAPLRKKNERACRKAHKVLKLLVRRPEKLMYYNDHPDVTYQGFMNKRVFTPCLYYKTVGTTKAYEVLAREGLAKITLNPRLDTLKSAYEFYKERGISFAIIMVVHKQIINITSFIKQLWDEPSKSVQMTLVKSALTKIDLVTRSRSYKLKSPSILRLTDIP